MRIFRLIWWDKIQQKPQSIDLPFETDNKAFMFLTRMPGMDMEKRCSWQEVK